jgi:hypothetical protein
MTSVDLALTKPERQIYRNAMRIMTEENIPFLVGGAYALRYYAGVVRDTKDFDIFILRKDCNRLLRLFAANGFRTEITARHWLAKAHYQQYFIDIIFGSYNKICEVDAEWFKNAVHGRILGMPVRLIPPEEMIWCKSYVMERDRFDNADIVHIIHALGPHLNWDRLVRRFGDHWRVLFSHLVLYGFIYPSDKTNIPLSVINDFSDRMKTEALENGRQEMICRGTLLSRTQYVLDVDKLHYADARLAPLGLMTADEILE